jgi:hypothetical protein
MRAATLSLASVCLTFLGAAGPLAAQRSSASGGITSDAAIALRLGTLGVGLEAGKQLTDHVAARVGFNFGTFNRSGNEQSNVSYDVNLKLQAGEALVDLYPSSRGTMHFTLGVITDPMKITGTGQPSASGTFNINNQAYSSAQVGTLSAEGKFPGVLPYVGLGFGSPVHKGGRVSFLFDVGAGIGKPTLSLTSSGAGNNAALRADLDAQRAKTQTDLDKLSVYPVVSIGLGFHL